MVFLLVSSVLKAIYLAASALQQMYNKGEFAAIT